MAVVHKEGAPLCDKGMSSLGKTIVAFVSGTLVCLGLANAGYDFAAVVTFFATILLSDYIYKDAAIAFKGSWGEHKALSGLENKLSDDYHIFVGVKVHEKMESDLVITGPNGVFVIEVKNYNGEIEGSESDKEWVLHKTGRGGGTYTKTIKNPLGQLRRNVYVLSQYLKIQKTPAWIEGRTYFANRNDWYEGCIPDKCIADMDVLAHFIRIYMPRRYLTTEQLTRINDNLEKCISETPAMSKTDFDIATARLVH